MQHKLKKLIMPHEQDSSDFITNKKQQLEAILKQNQASKEVIDKLRSTNNQSNKKSSVEFQGLEFQLKQLAVKIDSEYKKNKVLKELIAVMNSEVLNTKKTEVLENCERRTTREKRIKKEQYDIEQILQKHNEEIAKINILKQQVSASRRERVVYSNLFKKIEKQIKIYQEKYKETLLYAHQAQNKKAILYEEMNQKKKFSDKLTNRNESTHNKNYDEANKFIGFQNQNQNFFVTSPLKKKPEPAREVKKNLKNTLMYEELENYKMFFDKLKAETGYGTVDELTDKFSNIEQENQVLMDNANQLNYQIEIRSQILKELQMNRRSAQERHSLLNNSNTSENRIQKVEDLINKQKIEMDKYLNKISAIACLLNIHNKDCQDLSLDSLDDYLKGIQERLTEMTFVEREIEKTIAHTESKRRNLEDSEIQVEEMIQKADKYFESEKIFTKQLFLDEYSKEVTRLRKHKAKK